MPTSEKKIVFILGPTASGKSRLAYQLAKRIKAEIISADSMQVYKGMPLLTSYPAPFMVKAVPHHLISTVAVSKEYNAARFIKDANAAIKKILKKKKLPLVVGGSGLYINALLDGLFKGPSKDKRLREKLESQAKEFGNSYLHNRLKQLDAQSASEIHPNNLKRIIRALEVCLKSGRPMSQLKKKRAGIWTQYEVILIGLNRSRSQLYQRIDRRVDTMFKKGAVREAREALKLNPSQTAAKIIGLKEIRGFINKEYNQAEAKRLLKRNSRHLAKRQMTWFRAQGRIHWVEISEGDAAGEVVRKILKII